MKRTLLALLVIASTARADVWKRAVDGKDDALAKASYDHEMTQGDDYLSLAATRSSGRITIKNNLNEAINHYRAAAKAMPKEAEPHYRIAASLYVFYFELCDRNTRHDEFRGPLCDPDHFDTSKAADVIAEIDELEKRNAIDPRLCTVTFAFGSSLYFERAILHTKFGTKDHLEKAAEDYRRILLCHDTNEGGLDTVWSNLAETYMMLGNLTASIDAYREAIRGTPSTSLYYGLAVAFDRDGSPDLARDYIVSQGANGYTAFTDKVRTGEYFYVPKGEEHYYLALGAEILDQPDVAIAHWREYVKSGVHPQYQPRAKEHLDALVAKHRNARPIPPSDLDLR